MASNRRSICWRARLPISRRRSPPCRSRSPSGPRARPRPWRRCGTSRRPWARVPPRISRSRPWSRTATSSPSWRISCSRAPVRRQEALALVGDLVHSYIGAAAPAQRRLHQLEFVQAAACLTERCTGGEIAGPGDLRMNGSSAPLSDPVDLVDHQHHRQAGIPQCVVASPCPRRPSARPRSPKHGRKVHASRRCAGRAVEHAVHRLP